MVLNEVRRDLDRAIDRLMAVVSSEYQLEQARIGKTKQDGTSERIRALLEGGAFGGRPSGYDMEAWHIGLASDEELPQPLIKRFAERMRWQTLAVAGEHGQSWAWFGGSTPPSPALVMEGVREARSGVTAVVVGEPRFGLEGWRQTLREARLGLEYPEQPASSVLRARDVLLTVAVLKNAVVARALLDTYTNALEAIPASGELQRTLRAYFASGQNTTTAASELGVDRRTVERRLRAFEKVLGKTVEECHLELPLALEVYEMSVTEREGT
ncbi:MAG: helix-turn-helix domain-containing protein [Solirubrobacterales bacterium]